VLLRENTELKKALKESVAIIEQLQKEILGLRTEIQFLKNGRNSSTSSTPGSQDYGRSNQYNSRKKSSRKPGGQKGHKGSSLKMATTPDEIKKYIPQYCSVCGEEFTSESVFALNNRKQEIVIPPLRPSYVEHQSYSCTCGKCGAKTTSRLPSYLKSNIQYGEDIQSLITYLSVYQYMPSNRIKSYLQDIMGLEISEGTIYNILESMSSKAFPVYQIIKERIFKSKVVGGDETGIKINKKRAWFWVFQNELFTFIKPSYSRGYKTIEETFAQGFPGSVYVSDSLSAQLKIDTKAKQLCMAHLMRELKNFEKALKSKWAKELKQLFKEAVAYKKQMTSEDYSKQNQKVAEFENRFTRLLLIDYTSKHRKLRAFIKRLIKNRNSIFTFLYYPEVPPDNNGSERAVRNAKVKMKISNQFKSFDFAHYYAVIRSVIDTTIKHSGNVFEALSCLANQNIIAAE